MRIIYICEPNCTINKSLDALLIKKCGYKLQTIPLIDAKCIILFGNTQVSTQVFNMLFKKGIDLVFMTVSGRVKGRVMAEKASNVILRIAQFDAWKDENKKIEIARSIIKAKIKNQISLLEQHLKHNVDARIRNIIGEMKNEMVKLNNCKSIQKLMGVEGIASKYYFEAFSLMLKYFEFKSRQKRPAYDPVNAILNLTYAFLNNEILTRLDVYSFDTELGFLHGIRYGRKSLALDLMEEFRSLMADQFVLHLLNKKLIVKEDFNVSEEGCVLLTESLKKYCRLYHEYIEEKPSKEENWKSIFDKQIKAFRDCILEGGEYRTYLK